MYRQGWIYRWTRSLSKSSIVRLNGESGSKTFHSLCTPLHSYNRLQDPISCVAKFITVSQSTKKGTVIHTCWIQKNINIIHNHWNINCRILKNTSHKSRTLYSPRAGRNHACRKYWTLWKVILLIRRRLLSYIKCTRTIYLDTLAEGSRF